MKKTVLFSAFFFFTTIAFYGCKKEPYIAEGNYINPPKDSVSFGYRLKYLFFKSLSNDTTKFEFLLDTGIGYRWTEVDIQYKFKKKKYLVEYNTSGYIERLFDYSADGENVDIEYKNVSPMYSRLISEIRYHRRQNPFALQFTYNNAGELISLSRKKMDLNGSPGEEQERIDFCPNENLGDCSDSLSYSFYAYSIDYNTLLHCNELAPFLLILSKPNQDFLLNIYPTLPYYFSRKLPTHSLVVNNGTYVYGMTSQELSFIRHKPLILTDFEQYSFTKRLN